MDLSKWIEKNNEIMRRDELGQLSLSKDKEAIELYLEHIKSKTKQFSNQIARLRYLVEEDYYIDVFKDYSEETLLELLDYAYSFGFEFQSFMAASKFYDTYALKTRDKSQWLEDFEQHNVIVSLYLAGGDVDLAKRYIKAHTLQTVQTATPTYLNAGRKHRGELASCYLFTMDDTLNSINFIRSQVSQASKIAGGVAVNLTRLRGRGATLKGVKNVGKGIVPVAKLIEGEVSYADQLGQRAGAGAAYLNIFHSDVIELLNTKKVNADEDTRLATLSIGLIVPSLFFDLAKEDKDLYMFEPYSIQEEFGKDVILDDININDWYDKFVENENVIKHKINAREMLNLIAQIQLQSGYPYIMYKDNANKNHALNELGEIKMSNLCVTGDTELLTEKGYVKAKDLYESQEDLKVVIDNRTKNYDINNKGTDIVNAIPMQLTAKQAEIYEITTKQGFKIKSTEWHKYYRKINDSIEKVQLNQLEVGDKLLVQSGNGSYGDFHDPKLAFLMGLIAGDGTFGRDGSVKIYLYHEKQYLKETIEELVAYIIDKYRNKNEFLHHSANLHPKFVENKELQKLTISSVELYKILSRFGFNRETKLRFPNLLKNATKNTITAYLSGLYQMDACVNTNEKYKAMGIELTTISEELARDIQMQLLNLGVYSSIYQSEREISLLPDGNGGMKEYKVQNTYKISIQDRSSRDLFMKEVALKPKDIHKAMIFNLTLRPNSRKPKHDFTAEITEIKYIGKEDVYDTTQEDYHSLIFNGIVTGNCTEIFQYMHVSDIKDYNEQDELGQDIICNLASLNMVKSIEEKEIEESIRTGMRALTFVANNSRIEHLPTVHKANKNNRAVGLGVMSFHSMCAKNKIRYGSEESLDLLNVYCMMMDYYSLDESMKIAVERNDKFYGFDQTDYKAKDGKEFGEYFYKNNRVTKNVEPITPKIKEIFKGIYIPTKEDWQRLAREVDKNGLYNSYRLSIAPY
ncbi:LAGLIDADG family homing endonuclease [Staphylococcus sp. HMSC067G10]|uniref:LAGLIDADG family homing endonuclease n=1 Tax=Staphylococcus sp. HMSC067G10 TaxID=1715028 RepID=UPI003524F915